MPPVNVLVMVHGMVPDAAPSSPFPQYEAFWQALRQQQPGLAAAMPHRIGVQWGHEMPELTPPVLAVATLWGYQPPSQAKLRPDERLTDAQVYIGSRVDYAKVRSDSSPQHVVLNGPFNDDGSLLFFLRPIIGGLRENILLRGFGDAVYYCSAEGERTIRRQVYDHVLSQLDAIPAPAGVRLHVIGHSLGATIAHDFLYGLFADVPNLDYTVQALGTAAKQRFANWRAQAKAGMLTLGSFVTFGSQLPLFVQRVQKLVNQLADNQPLDPSVLGITLTDPRPRWLNFYDIDDLLGFPTRRLYQECPALVEVQVDSNDTPDRAHIDYWVTPAVIERTAALLAANAV